MEFLLKRKQNKKSGLARRNFVQLSVAGSVCSLVTGCAENVSCSTVHNQNKPNIVFIFSDDQGPYEVGCYGGNVLTPNIDSLAAEGMKFERFYVNSSLCNPSRYNVLTGKYASRSNSQQWKYPPGGPVNINWEASVYHEGITMAHVLQRNGYVTGMVGKWMQGQCHDREKKLGNVDINDPRIKRIIERNYQQLTTSIKKCGFDYVEGAFVGNVGEWLGDKPYSLPVALRHHNPEWVTAAAIDFLEMYKDKQFFLYMPTTLVHTPDASKEIEVDPRITPKGMLDKPVTGGHPPRKTLIERLKKADLPIDHVRVANLWMDDSVGAVLKKLEELQIADNTVIIYAGDNGRIDKGSCYEAGARMPLIVRWPRMVNGGVVCNDLCSGIDIPATIFDICQIKNDYNLGMDGKSLKKAILQEGYVRESVFLEVTTERAVVTQDGYKYIAVRFPENAEATLESRKLTHFLRPTSDINYETYKRHPAYFEQDQLYDLDNDPMEQVNLAGKAEYAERLDKMKKLLKEYSSKLPHTFGEIKK